MQVLYIFICVFFLIVSNHKSIKFVCLVLFILFYKIKPLETRKFTRQIRSYGNVQLLFYTFFMRKHYVQKKNKFNTINIKQKIRERIMICNNKSIHNFFILGIKYQKFKNKIIDRCLIVNWFRQLQVYIEHRWIIIIYVHSIYCLNFEIT